MSARGELLAENAVRFTRMLAAAPDRVWQFLTEPSRLPEWYGARENNEPVIEPREGGAVSLMGGHVRGVVTQWRPASLLGYTWNVFQPGEAQSSWPVSYLELALEGMGSETRLTLTHRPIMAGMQNQTMMGWHTMLDLLEAGLAGETLTRAELFPKNAAQYGVDLSNLKR